MPSFNRVTLMGNLTRDPQMKHLPNSTTVADFGLAMSRRYKTQAGDDREEVCFVDCTAFGRQAEVIGQYCTKGKPLFVEGRLKFDQWDDKNSGARRSKLSVVIENFQFVGGPGDDNRDRDPITGRQKTFDDARQDPDDAPPAAAVASAGKGRPARRPAKARAAEGEHFTDADIPF